MSEVKKMGRIFKNMSEAINEIERDIVEMGITVHPHTMQNKDVRYDDSYSTLEVQNYSFTIMDCSDKDKLVGDCLSWCNAEFKERIASLGKNPGDAWKLRKEVWEEFLDDGKFNYTYNERINKHSQLNLVIKELQINPDTRQAVIMIHHPEDKTKMQIERIPCSLSYQYMIRRGKLDVIYTMRSSDFNTHFKNDVWQADELRNYIAKFLKIQPGLLHMNIGSLHIYKNYNNKIVF